MKMKLSLLCAAGALSVIVAGCTSPQLSQTPYSESEKQWSEYISNSYPEWKAPRTVPPSSDGSSVISTDAPVLLNLEPVTDMAPLPPIKEGEKKVEAQTYTVQQGDTLSKIAHKFYGKASKWPVILEANKDKISDAGKLKSGTTINIPAQ
ncbi:MAG TPA: hypothetical protein DCZ94_19255 [Lentisphaeria bacterium]|nr:MAG: hypothetical protein A2X48_01500 [Lentisphaerae bacterium GWF2_49_21]HBC89082.1 hypothetical protein [Lentisphaeria bacterium]